MPKHDLTRLAFMPDTHFPYHDVRAFRIFLNAMREFEPHGLFILGDAIDCYSVSDHDRDPARCKRLLDEFGVANREFDKVEDIMDDRVVYIEGNHEDRLRRYVWRRAPELHGMIDLSESLGIARRGWKRVAYQDHYRLGKLYVTHDVGRTGKHAVSQSLDDYGANVVIGHVHKIGYVVHRTVRGKPHFAMCPGWLGDLEAIDYRHRVRKTRDWCHGFGVGYMEPGGNVHVRPVPIVDRRCVLGGKVIKS